MNEDSLNFKKLCEDKTIFSNIVFKGSISEYSLNKLTLKEVNFECPKCETLRPFHNLDDDDIVFRFYGKKFSGPLIVDFECVTCNSSRKSFSIFLELTEESIKDFSCEYVLTKFGEYPRKPLKKNKELVKFFKEDKDEYDKALVCLAQGYGVAAFAYMRRIVEKNINHILDMILESEEEGSSLIESIAELKNTSPMSEKIKIANKALPSYLKPEGFNPLGTIYAVLSDGVHSLSDEKCLQKAENIQACIEFMISELVHHKKNKELFKNRLSSLR